MTARQTTDVVFKTPLQLLIATILSAQCTDKRVNLVTPALFKRYRAAADFAAAPAADPPLDPAVTRLVSYGLRV